MSWLSNSQPGYIQTEKYCCGIKAHLSSQQQRWICHNQAWWPGELGTQSKYRFFLAYFFDFFKRNDSLWHFYACYLELLVAHDLRLGVLRCGDDAHGSTSLRHGSLWSCVPSQSKTSWRHDRRWYTHQQDGSCFTQGMMWIKCYISILNILIYFESVKLEGWPSVQHRSTFSSLI